MTVAVKARVKPPLLLDVVAIAGEGQRSGTEKKRERVKVKRPT